MTKNKKYILSLGLIAAAMAPVMTVVACGSSDAPTVDAYPAGTAISMMKMQFHGKTFQPTVLEAAVPADLKTAKTNLKTYTTLAQLGSKLGISEFETMEMYGTQISNIDVKAPTASTADAGMILNMDITFEKNDSTAVAEGVKFALAKDQTALETLTALNTFMDTVISKVGAVEKSATKETIANQDYANAIADVAALNTILGTSITGITVPAGVTFSMKLREAGETSILAATGKVYTMSFRAVKDTQTVTSKDMTIKSSNFVANSDQEIHSKFAKLIEGYILTSAWYKSASAMPALPAGEVDIVQFGSDFEPYVATFAQMADKVGARIRYYLLSATTSSSEKARIAVSIDKGIYSTGKVEESTATKWDIYSSPLKSKVNWLANTANGNSNLNATTVIKPVADLTTVTAETINTEANANVRTAIMDAIKWHISTSKSTYSAEFNSLLVDSTDPIVVTYEFVSATANKINVKPIFSGAGTNSTVTATGREFGITFLGTAPVSL